VGDRPAVVIAHPSPDLYGSDRMVIESVRALAEQWRVVVVLPADGPLSDQLRGAGGEVVILAFPVLRKAFLSPRGIVRLGLAAARAFGPMMALLRRERPVALYVNTVTIPFWLAVARLSRVPALCHVHEAEDSPSRLARLALVTPLRLARMVVANSLASARLLSGGPKVIHNGFDGPASAVPARSVLESPVRLVVVGRLSPRKGNDVAIKAAGVLADRGLKVTLTLVGSIFPGYEWFLDELHDLAADVDGVEFAGFQPTPWEALAESDVVLVPSRAEPFGNVAVEAMLAGRPVVASATQGLVEIVSDGENGVLVAPDDPVALADGIQTIVDDWDASVARAQSARIDAQRRFSKARYHRELRDAVQSLADAPRRTLTHQ
jgi:glycosyltransferase involved in cell wall biosynthesis